MANNVLVLYATRGGSTREIAELIVKQLAASGMEAELLPVQAARSFDGCDTVVLGSAVRMGRLMPEMVRFVKKHKSRLSRYPVAAFAVCLSMKEETPEQHTTAEAFLDPIRREVPLISEGLFAGKMDYSKLDFFARLIVSKMVKAPEGDFTDRRKIEEWTEALEKRLEAETTKETVIEMPDFVGV
ncbi:MAG: flavodoxin domain-containing protein [Chitinispirillaceae bacterium]|nr:flavodoxin domain-containing protein [Chitinispirillaceae bacterium]